MDNQQERLSVDLSWLAGAWESEGWFSIGFQKKKYGSQYAINCGIVNSDMEFINEVKKILTINNLAYYVSPPRISGIGKKPKIQIVIIGLKRNNKFLNIIMPYLRTKKRRAEIIMNFIDFRKKRPNPKTPYGIIEEKLFKELKQLNNRTTNNILREQAPNIVNNDNDVLRTI